MTAHPRGPRRRTATAARSSRRLVAVLLAGALVVASALLGALAPASAADSHALIQGSGSSWAENALNQWIADVHSQGLQVVYTGSGSAQGRQDFANRTVDFAETEIGYQGRDPLTGVSDTSQGRAYAYLPVVGGGTSFPYQIKIGGQPVTNLRLSGETIAKIFTNQITYWDDPEITADNNGRRLPHLKIIPVVHSEGSGATAQLTKYFANQYPSIWTPYAGANNFTEYYPRKGDMVAQDGSSQVINYVESSAANSAIGYDEYSYALLGGYPVAKMLNKAGYYTLPNQYNVAVALTQAVINQDKSSPNYLLQTLNKVYVYTDKRTYPLSSYSYGLIPTASNDATMTTAKRQTLADFLYYGICQGQREVGPIGYSPLPVNLVQASFAQIGRLKQADPGVDLTNRSVSTCGNPTFVSGHPSENYLAKIAPEPPACDAQGQGPCVGTTSVSVAGSGGSGGSAGSGGSGGSGGTTGGGASTGGSGGSGPTSTARATARGGGTTDPLTGQAAAAGSGAVGAAQAVPTTLAGYRNPDLLRVLAPVVVVLLVLALVAPPVVVPLVRRRRGGGV